MKTEIGRMQLQAKDCQEPPDARKRQRKIPPSMFGGSTALLTS